MGRYRQRELEPNSATKPQTLFAAAVLSLAALTELNAVVTITRQPISQWVSRGASVTLAVTATCTALPITFQWWGKGVLLPTLGKAKDKADQADLMWLVERTPYWYWARRNGPHF